MTSSLQVKTTGPAAGNGYEIILQAFNWESCKEAWCAEHAAHVRHAGHAVGVVREVRGAAQGSALAGQRVEERRWEGRMRGFLGEGKEGPKDSSST